jgi:putative ATP-binding cassette transporter
MTTWHDTIKPIRAKLIAAILAGIIGGLSTAWLLALVANVLRSLGSTDRIDGSVYFLLCALMIVSRAASAIFVMHVGQAVAFHLKLNLSQAILCAPFRKLQTIGAPRLFANLTDDVATIAAAFESVPWICVHSAVVVGCLIYLGFLSLAFFWMIVGILLVGVASFVCIKGQAMRALASARTLNDTLYVHFRSLVDGIKELKLNSSRRIEFLTSLVEPTAREYRKQYELGTIIIILAGQWGNSLFYITIGVILFIIPISSNGNFDGLSGYVLVILYMSSPVAALLDSVPALGRARIAMSRIHCLECELGKTDPGTDRSGSAGRRNSSAQIELKNIVYRYRSEGDEHDFAIGPLSLVLSPGEIVFIVGGNGTGKTTLALVLVGLYAPNSGEILLNGDLVTDLTRAGYREHFSAVFSDSQVIGNLPVAHGTLDREAQRYLEYFQLDRKVKLTDGLFSTIELSDGQRKRLAMIAAYLEDRPCYVFDEWAANQDPLFKKVFYSNILPDLKARGKTVVVITHDDQYFFIADRCIRLI